MNRVRAFLILAAAMLASCSHGELFTPATTTSTVPLSAGAPTRLTYSPGTDEDAAWLPDESAFLYSADQADRPDHDRCLVLMPATGGRLTSIVCTPSLASRDSLNAFESAAVSPGGQVAFVRTSRPPTQTAPRFTEVVISTLAAIADATPVRSLPFTVGGTLYGAASQLHWLDEQTILYRADFAGMVCVTDPAVQCRTQFVQAGINVVRQAFGGVLPVVIPGTAGVSSFVLDPGGGAMLYTLVGDRRVYRLDFSTGVSGVIFDFGPAGIARGLQLNGTKLFAIVGGSVTVLPAAWNGPNVPPVQLDGGGPLLEVDLASSAITRVNADSLPYNAPALSPSGKRLVAERGGDLWLFDLP